MAQRQGQRSPAEMQAGFRIQQLRVFSQIRRCFAYQLKRFGVALIQGCRLHLVTQPLQPGIAMSVRFTGDSELEHQRMQHATQGLQGIIGLRVQSRNRGCAGDFPDAHRPTVLHSAHGRLQHTPAAGSLDEPTHTRFGGRLHVRRQQLEYGFDRHHLKARSAQVRGQHVHPAQPQPGRFPPVDLDRQHQHQPSRITGAAAARSARQHRRQRHDQQDQDRARQPREKAPGQGESGRRGGSVAFGGHRLRRAVLFVPGRFGLGTGLLCRCARLGCRNPAIAIAADRLDVPRAIGVAQQSTQLQDGLRERAIADMGMAPDVLDQLIPPHGPVPMRQ